MDNKIATFTFFTLLFLYTVSAARPVDLTITNPTAIRTNDASKLPKTSREYMASTGRSKIVLPGEKVMSDKPTNDLTPRTNFSRFHPINRHFQGRHNKQPQHVGTQRRPCLKHTQYKIPFPQKESSVKKGEVVVERNDKPKLNNENSVRSKTFRGEVPANWLKVKHHYGSRQQHNNQNHHSQTHKKEENVKKTKNHVFDREKMKSLRHQQKLKKNENKKSALMKNIRKFLKHTFD